MFPKWNTGAIHENKLLILTNFHDHILLILKVTHCYKNLTSKKTLMYDPSMEVTIGSPLNLFSYLVISLIDDDSSSKVKLNKNKLT